MRLYAATHTVCNVENFLPYVEKNKRLWKNCPFLCFSFQSFTQFVVKFSLFSEFSTFPRPVKTFTQPFPQKLSTRFFSKTPLFYRFLVSTTPFFASLYGFSQLFFGKLSTISAKGRWTTPFFPHFRWITAKTVEKRTEYNYIFRQKIIRCALPRQEIPRTVSSIRL